MEAACSFETLTTSHAKERMIHTHSRKNLDFASEQRQKWVRRTVFLDRQAILGQSRNFPNCMETTDSLSCSQQPYTLLSPEPDESTVVPHILFKIYL